MTRSEIETSWNQARLAPGYQRLSEQLQDELQTQLIDQGFIAPSNVDLELIVEALLQKIWDDDDDE